MSRARLEAFQTTACKLGLKSKQPRSKLRGIHSRTIVMGAAAPKPLLAHSSRQQADGYSGNTNKTALREWFSEQRKLAGCKREFDQVNVIKIINEFHPCHSSVDKVSAGPNFIWPNTTYFWASCQNSGITPISQNSVFSAHGLTNNPQVILQALRNVIRQDISNLRESFGGSARCHECNQFFDMRELDIHHAGANTFKAIVNKFEKDWNIELRTMAIQRPKPSWVLPAKQRIIDGFKSYHRDYAVLQPICKPCHREITHETA